MGIINKLKATGRLEVTLLLIIMSLFCFTLSVFRFWITDTKVFLFLNWNLFLAFIPWLSSSVIFVFPWLQKQKLSLFILLSIWLLFFPNAPYILTDLFHLRLKTGAPIWFDLVLILSFAWTGLLFGFVSLMDIEKLLTERFKKWISLSVIGILLFMAGFGVYVGRFLRWNSWDIIQQPRGLLVDIADRFIHPFDHPRTWALTILLGLLLNAMYFSIKLMKKQVIVMPS